VRRTIYGPEHEAFRETVRTFLAKEVEPHYGDWETAGRPPRDFFTKAGALGILGLQVPSEFGGGGASFTYNAIVTEEIGAMSYALGVLRVHADITVPYFVSYCTPQQRARWLPGLASGGLVAALALTEPAAGSDLAGIGTVARRDGEDYVVSGQKTFITGGLNADLFVTAVKTDPTARHAGVTLLVLEPGMAGFRHGRPLEKVGLHAQEAVELFFDDVRVPAANLLGEEGRGFTYLTANLPQERLSIAINAQSSAAGALAMTVDYVKQRSVFGQLLSSLQNTKFELAACATDIAAGQALVDQALAAHDEDALSPADAARVKLFCTEMQGRVVDRCLQLFGGYGYMREYRIARAWTDARVGRIYGGTSEIMKTIIAKDLGL
jgi:long-chain-acyl-CoA dehydrogenase